MLTDRASAWLLDEPHVFGVPQQRQVVFSGVTRNSLVILPLVLALPAHYDLAALVVVASDSGGAGCDGDTGSTAAAPAYRRSLAEEDSRHLAVLTTYRTDQRGAFSTIELLKFCSDSKKPCRSDSKKPCGMDTYDKSSNRSRTTVLRRRVGDNTSRKTHDTRDITAPGLYQARENSLSCWA